MGVRRQAREAALQALFMCDALQQFDVATALTCFEHFGIPEAVRPYSETIAKGVIENLSDIESKISCASDHWSLSRMAKVDRCILRLATYEILFLDDIPVGVAIDEAIEIAKRFGTENSSTFVNGVLDRVATSIRKQIEVLHEPMIPKDTMIESGGIAAESSEGDLAKSESDDWRLL